MDSGIPRKLNILSAEYGHYVRNAATNVIETGFVGRRPGINGWTTEIDDIP